MLWSGVASDDPGFMNWNEGTVPVSFPGVMVGVSKDLPSGKVNSSEHLPETTTTLSPSCSESVRTPVHRELTPVEGPQGHRFL